MLETILKLYRTATLGHVYSPMPHLFGPWGSGKSSVVREAANLLGVNLHIINVSRISPLEIEGVQMPVDDNSRLRMLTATFWTSLKDGDILLLEEFLRGFPEVYNGLLDILTSREVGGFKIPNVFIIGASNSTATYDEALEDRLLHLPVPDPRKKKGVKTSIAKRIVAELGLLPEMVSSNEMDDVLHKEIFPTYAILDQLGPNHSASRVKITGRSMRNLIGQARLREVQSTTFAELIATNNREAIQRGKYQHVLLLDGAHADPKYIEAAKKLAGNPKLTEIQALNLAINQDLIEVEAQRKEERKVTQDDDILFTVE